MEEINGFNTAVKVLGEKIAQLETEVRIGNYFKDKFEELAIEHDKLKSKYEALVDKLNEYCAGGNK